MEKVIITIDLAKINKDRVNARQYGEGQVSKDYKLELVPLKESKVIKEGDTWQMVKKYFVTDAATPDERKAKTKMQILGDGIVFENKGALPEVETPF